MNLYTIIRRGADHHPDRAAIHFREQVISYGALGEQVDALADSLRRRGIGSGDRVAVLLPNCPQFTVIYFAVTALGAVCVPANPLLKAPELVWIWGDSEVKLVFTAPLLMEQVAEALKSLPCVREVIGVGAEAGAPGVTAFDDVMAEGRPSPVDATGIDIHSPAVTIYTSGTEGRPKGALLSHNNLVANCRQVTEAVRFTPDDNFLCVLPLFHSFAGTVCQNTPLYCGAATTYVEMFHPTRVLATIEEKGVTIFPAVPAMFAALLQAPQDRAGALRTVRLAISGGAPMPVALMDPFEQRYGIPILEGDGPTECSPVTAVNPPQGVRKAGTIGLPIPGVAMRIVDENDVEVPRGTVGEIVVRGENVMLGYHNLPEATAEAMRGGWYHTGDLGTCDEDGYFSIVDRKKDMVIVGGINVYPREVEEVLYSHPAVADAAVIGTAHALRGEEVVAIIALKPDAQASGRELIQYCREKLANYKVPRRVVFRDALPRSVSGKVLKRLLRKEMEMEAAGP